MNVMYENRKLQIKEIHPPSGGDWGSCNIDKRIFKLLSQIFGHEFMQVLSKEEDETMLELEKSIEKMKHEIDRNYNVNSTPST